MLFTTEAVSKGHPDKFCDQVSDKITQYILTCTKHEDIYNKGKAAIEVLAKNQTIVIAGEYWLPNKQQITLTKLYELVDIVVRDIGYTTEYEIINLLEQQSIEIRNAVSQNKEIGAGDQGMMFGYATNITDGYLPVGYYYAQKIMREYATFIQTNKAFRPDAKCQIAVDENNNIKQILISAQHIKDIKHKEIVNDINDFLLKVLGSTIYDGIQNIIINPSGSFISGGFEADCGLTGRKIINDSYGSFARHGGGAFSGKDYTKVDRSGAYIARYWAKQFVASNYCDRCEIQISYCIGISKPFSIRVKTFGTAKNNITDNDLTELLHKECITPLYIFDKLKLYQEENLWQIYESSKHGHFTNSQFTWENL